MNQASRKITAVLLSATMAASAAPLFSASAEQVLLGYRGDVNHDMQVNAADLVGLCKHIFGIDPLGAEYLMNADLNDDNYVDCFDMTVLRQCLTGQRELIGIYSEEETPTEPPTEETTEAPTEAPTEPPTSYEPEESADFIPAAIDAVGASLPTKNNANLVIFYVDFPDCRYENEPSTEELQEMAFGEADSSNPMYPFESMSAFYERSSKGEMQLSGKVFRYTTKENQSAYDTDKVKIAEECYDAFKDSEDFAQYDGDGDGMIDATLFTVPEAAGSDNWWPCAGGFGDPNYSVDGKSIGHIITGNAQANSTSDYSNFVSSYLHEMGHCMGLPDYYLYSSNDSEGFHGNAGIELMDTDATTDFGAFSKLMLGWYRENQVQVYDSSAGSQTFTLSNAQTDAGNCVIIPYGNLDDRYFSEYFIIEYITDEANNSKPAWWVQGGSGVRIFHAKADLQEDYWWTYLKYQNGSEYTNGDDNGIRLLRLVNDVDGDNFFRTGSVIDNSVSGFGWYDSSENESIDPGVTISIGELTENGYSITVSNK